MLVAWTLSKRYCKPPSDIYHISDELAAYCFDEAVLIFGLAIEDDMQKAADKAKNEAQSKMKQARVMAKWMGGDKNAKGRFRDPMIGARKG